MRLPTVAPPSRRLSWGRPARTAMPTAESGTPSGQPARRGRHKTLVSAAAIIVDLRALRNFAGACPPVKIRLPPASSARMWRIIKREAKSMQIKVNGVERSYDGDPNLPLLWYVRDVLGLTGTKFGCGMALCGACTVHQDGKAIRSCVTSVSAAAGKEITTIEAISKNGLHPVQAKWIEFNVPQCGYCQTGQIMQAISLLKDKPKPSDEDIDAGMAGNICRCGTYQRIRAAIKAAAGENA